MSDRFNAKCCYNLEEDGDTLTCCLCEPQCTMSKVYLEQFSERHRHLHPNQVAFMFLNNRNFRQRAFSIRFRYWNFFEFHIARVEARRNMFSFADVKLSIPKADLPFSVKSTNATKKIKAEFWKDIKTFHTLCFSQETKELFSIVKDTSSRQNEFTAESLQVLASKSINQPEAILNHYMVGYLQMLTPDEYHVLHYLGYNSLFIRPIGGMTEFYILYGPIVFCNHSKTSQIKFKKSSCTDALSSLSLKVVCKEDSTFRLRKNQPVCIDYGFEEE